MALSREELADLLRAQAAVMKAVAAGVRSPTEANDEFRRQHVALRQELTAYNLPCLCPWPQVYAVPGYVAKHGGDWETVVDGLLEPYAALIDAQEQPRWSLEMTDQFRAKFDELNQDQQAVLDDHFRTELGPSGMDLREDRSKLESMDCPGRLAGNVEEYKVEAKGRGQKIMVRVFLQTKPNHTLLLLWVYDKAANPSKSHQNAQRDRACQLRVSE